MPKHFLVGPEQKLFKISLSPNSKNKFSYLKPYLPQFEEESPTKNAMILIKFGSF